MYDLMLQKNLYYIQGLFDVKIKVTKNCVWDFCMLKTEKAGFFGNFYRAFITLGKRVQFTISVDFSTGK